MRITKKTFGVISKGVVFLRRQQRDWKATLMRTSSAMFLYRMVLPYVSVYAMALGATGTQLGIISSVGMGISGLISPFIGWLIDKIGVKKIYLIGIVLIAASYLVYGLAQGWTIIIIAMVAYWLGFGIAGHGCTVICGNSLANEDRATGMAICETFAAGILGLVAPMLGALLVTTFGGVNVSGIRPLFFVCLVGTIATFFLILTRLSNCKWGKLGEAGLNFFKDLSRIFKQGHNLKRWLLITCVGDLPFFVLLPFVQPFAHEVKGADQYILGAMVTAFAVVPLVLGIPLGRLADKIGRKRVVYLTMPLVWAFILMLIWAPSPGFLIWAGVLQGFIFISIVVMGAVTFELVPADQMGRWMGIVQFFRMILSAGAIYLAGVVWDNIGPQYLFLGVIVLDLLIRIPLLIGMPETLGLRLGAGQSELK
ncbi:MFS transporter [Chloroflexota bacterium]